MKTKTNAKRAWPTEEELLAWFLYWDTFARDPTRDSRQVPEKYLGLIRQFRSTPLVQTHSNLYFDCPGFKERFVDPEYKGDL